jgi:hypothetical protein
MTGNVASTTGTAPLKPAQPITRRSRASQGWKAVVATAASGRATNATTKAKAVTSRKTSPNSLGKAFPLCQRVGRGSPNGARGAAGGAGTRNWPVPSRTAASA